MAEAAENKKLQILQFDPAAAEDSMINVKKRRGIYLLPNLFTTASLFAGFYAMVAAMKGLYGSAAFVTFIAMLADSLDGRVARLTNTTSAFGGEYDSLSDMVAFGVAPALMMYTWALSALGKIGWLIAFCYTAATALRLARFNIQHDTMDKRYFRGLPCTSAAGGVAGLIWIQNTYSFIPLTWVKMIAAGVTVILALLMVSNIPYRSFKDSDFKNRVSFFTVLLVIIGFVGIAIDPPGVLFVIFSLYALSGPLLFSFRFIPMGRKKIKG